jgi:hypothetical protein
MSATLIKLASSHRLSPVDGVDEKTGHSYYGSRRPTVLFRTACLTRPNKFSDHRPLRFWAEWKTKTRHFVPRWGERSLSLAFAFSDFSFQLFPCGFTEPTLALVPRAKHRHGSARAR